MNAIEQLKWQREMGVEDVIEDTPQNHTAPRNAPTPSTQGFAETEANVTALAAPAPKRQKNESNLIANVRAMADACTTRDELKNAVTNFKQLAICKTATNTVFSDGTPQADVMCIGEAPGANEDIQGIPFCGDSGMILDNALNYVGISREKNMYISNSVFWRPPGNRKPTNEEVDACRPFVEKHIALIKPKVLVLIGGTATTALLETKMGITKLRGQQFQYSNQYLDTHIPTFAVFHPSYLMRQSGQKRVFWQDLLHIREFLDVQ